MEYRSSSKTPPSGTGPSSRRIDGMTLADFCADLILTGNVPPRFHQLEQFVDYSVQMGGSVAIFASQMARRFPNPGTGPC